MHISGKLLEIQATQPISDSFKKRVFIIEYAENPQYPEYISFECIQDRCELLDGFQEGEMVNVHFNLRGRKWTNAEGVVRYFNTLQAWRLEKVSHSSGSGSENTPLGQDTDDFPF